MKVGFVGCGEMGEPMAGHVLKKGKFEVWVFDVRKAATKAIGRTGAKIAGSLEELGRQCDLFIVMVGYDHQVRQVVTDLAAVGKKGAVIVITATTHPDIVVECAEIARKCGMAEAEEASRRARAVLGAGWPDAEAGRKAFAAFDAWLRADSNRRNPGTSADLVTACIFAALRDNKIMLPLTTPWSRR